MRTNLPVTQNQVELTDTTLIVSKTDLQGRITYINKDFLDISGFTENELIGEPHNLVRHPDMPTEAFEDFWRDLKAGRPWRGVVKNRRKDGGYYWVVAAVSPVREGGRGEIDGKPIEWAPAKAYDFANVGVALNGDLLVVSYDAVVSDLVMEGEQYRDTASPRMLTYLLSPEGKWELIALANFNVPKGVPADVECVSVTS